MSCASALQAGTCRVIPLMQLVVKNETNGTEQQADDANHDELVRHEPPRHNGQHAAGSGDIVVSAMQRVPRMRDGLPLPVEIPQDARAQLLPMRAGQSMNVDASNIACSRYVSPVNVTMRSPQNTEG